MVWEGGVSLPKTNTRKTVFFIVEGNTDKTALEKIFKAIYKRRDIRFQFTSGDITSDNTINKTNICNFLYKKVKRYIDDNKLKKTDIWQIVQIIDTDGTYIPEAEIKVGETKKLLYSTTNITCKDIQKVKDRNIKKKDMIDYLLSLDNIKDIDYKCFFMSSNLDHVLYGLQNLNVEDKRKYADAFYSLFINKEKLFIEFLQMEAVNGVPDNFPASWRYIKEALHSLERHTNLNIYFMENPYD